MSWRQQNDMSLGFFLCESCVSPLHRQTVCVLQPPKPPMPVAYDPALKLQDGKPVTKDLYSTTLAMLEQINAAIAKLPALST